MKNKKVKRLLALLLAGMVTITSMTTGVFAETTPNTGTVYEMEDAYVLQYRGTSAFVSRYKPRAVWYKEDGTLKISTDDNLPGGSRTGCIFELYTSNNEVVNTYCMDISIGTKENSLYRRLNLEDSIYSESSAGLIRSIVNNGFLPRSSASDDMSARVTDSLNALRTSSKVSDLTVCEAIIATQLAIWKATHGEAFTVTEFLHKTKYVINSDWNEELMTYFDIANEEFGTDSEGNPNIPNAEALAATEKRIETVYNYLLSLKPSNPTEVSVSGSSFTNWSEIPTANTDGTYNVSVEVTVDVQMCNDTDELKLSAVLDEYSATVDLENGKNTKTLTIENVPAELIFNGNVIKPVTIAIDGTQTVSDVFLFDAVGERKNSQTMVGICDKQLPVHAEIKVEPERILRFEKTGTVVGKDQNNETVTEQRPLEGIKFDMYFIADLDAYVNGNVIIDNETDLSTRDKVIDYVKSKTGKTLPDYTVVTGADGKAMVSLTKNNLPDGVYLIVEQEHIAIQKPEAPFFAMVPYYTNLEEHDKTEWVYDITAKPKNEVVGDVYIEKDVTEIGNNDSCYDVDEDHLWIISASVPHDIAEGKNYVISDTLDNRLNLIYDADKVNNENDYMWVQVEKAVPDSTTEPVRLLPEVDYTVSVTDNNSLAEGKPQDSFTISLTKFGMKKVASVVDSSEVKNASYNEYRVRVYFTTEINANATLGTQIPNQATINYTNSVNYDFDAKSDIPVVYTFGIRIDKVDANNQTKPLKGATFAMARPATEADKAEGSGVDVEPLTIRRVDETTGAEIIETIDVVRMKVYSSQKGEMPSSRVDYVTTNENGNAYIYGVKTGEYYLIEIAAPKNYNLLTYPVIVNVNANNAVTSEEYVQGVKVLNSDVFILPATGGIGTVIFTVGGAALIGGAVILLVLNKKREENEEA